MHTTNQQYDNILPLNCENRLLKILLNMVEISSMRIYIIESNALCFHRLDKSDKKYLFEKLNTGMIYI